MTQEEVMKVYNDLIETGIASDAELNLITDINGLNIETLNDVIYVRTGYRTYEQLMEEYYGQWKLQRN